MKILSIGNSFSQDSQRYLHKLAKAENCDLFTVNLFFPGCSLQSHYNHFINDLPNYELEINGESANRKVTISEALKMDNWDVVTLQQASHLSTDYQTYMPYMKFLTEQVKEQCEGAKIYVHQTWAYEDKSEKLKELARYSAAEDMFLDLCTAYERAKKDILADGFIPSGKAMINAVKLGLKNTHRDGFHASLGAGRYLLALTWYKALTGNDISGNDFDCFDEAVSQQEREIVIKAVNAAF